MQSRSPPSRRICLLLCLFQLLLLCSGVIGVLGRGEFCNGCTSAGDTFECPENHICTEDCPPFKQCVCTCVRAPTPAWMIVSLAVGTIIVCASMLYALIQLYRGEPLFQPCRDLCCPAEDSYERISAF